MTPDITVILATYNRARDLSRTLDGMVRADKANLSVEFVVVDNGSTDQTKSVVDLFAERLPLLYIYEGRSGKNRALNTAIEKVKLGNIIVFTDDDVDVAHDWLPAIHSVCERWPNHSVFGGKIDVVFPVDNPPRWVANPDLASLALAQHDYAKSECVYMNPYKPFGANYWVRRQVFENGRRFNEKIGPCQINRMMGSEYSFLHALLQDGHEIVYSPASVVGHRIQPEVLRFSAVCRRAYKWGQGKLNIYGLPQQNILKSHQGAWKVYRCGAIIWYAGKVAGAFLFSSNKNRLNNMVKVIINLGYHIEAFNLADR